MTSPTSTHGQAKIANERATGERFCTACRKYRSLEQGGAWKTTKSSRRWVCSRCVESANSGMAGK